MLFCMNAPEHISNFKTVNQGLLNGTKRQPNLASTLYGIEIFSTSV